MGSSDNLAFYQNGMSSDIVSRWPKELVQPKMKNLSNWKAVFPEPVLL